MRCTEMIREERRTEARAGETERDGAVIECEDMRCATHTMRGDARRWYERICDV